MAEQTETEGVKLFWTECDLTPDGCHGPSRGAGQVFVNDHCVHYSPEAIAEARERHLRADSLSVGYGPNL
jgi:hypothetical protein